MYRLHDITICIGLDGHTSNANCVSPRRIRRYRTRTAAANFLRYQSHAENYRNSTRSTTPLRNSGTHTRDFRPNLDKINECNLSREDDSLSSVVSRYHNEIAVVSSGKSTPCFANVHSYPNLVIAAQAPFSPYRLAWLTPTTTRMVRSDPSMTNSYPKYATTACPVPFNTPTEGSDGDNLPVGQIINDTHSYVSTDVTSCPPYGAIRHQGDLSGCSSLSDGNIPFSMMSSGSRHTGHRQSVRRTQWPESSHHKYYTTNMASGCLPGFASQFRFTCNATSAERTMPPTTTQQQCNSRPGKRLNYRTFVLNIGKH